MSKVRLSSRATEMPASPIRRLVPYADRAKARGIKVYHLNIGQPDIETPAEMMNGYRNVKNGYRNVNIRVLSYGPSQGLQDYIDALVQYYGRVGIKVRAQDILVTTGGSEAILFALDAVADTGDEVIVPEPFYTNYSGFAATACVKLVPVTCLAETGFALPPKAEFERAITSRTRAIIYSNPGNPTGAVYTRLELEMLEGLCVEHGLYLIGDEAYREFIYEDDTEHTSVLNLAGIEDRAGQGAGQLLQRSAARIPGPERLSMRRNREDTGGGLPQARGRILRCCQVADSRRRGIRHLHA